MKLELKHIAPYLPYELKMKDYNGLVIQISPIHLIKKLFEWHFDVFGLIPNKLAQEK